MISNVERRLRGSKVDVPSRLFRHHLGLPVGAEWTDDIATLAAKASDWYDEHGKPWSARRAIGITEIVEDMIHLEGGSRLTSAVFAAGLREVGAHELVVVAISAGPEVDSEIDRLWEAGRPDEAMFLNAYAISVTEHLRSREADHLAELAGRQGTTVLPHYSPGYEGWELSDQRHLHALIVDADLELPGPLELLPSGGLRPAKSTLAVFTITTSPEAGGVKAVGSRDPRSFWSHHRTVPLNAVPLNAVPLNPAREEPGPPRRDPPAYALPARTLERWASRRLTVTEAGDGRLHARFRFDGTTCSNMGLPLAFDFEVELARETDTHRVLACRCAPAAGDTGHRSMCGYLTAPEEFMNAIQEAPVWTGRTLDELMAWAPETSLTGCLCTRASRDHKWRVFIQTLHYALGQTHCKSRRGFQPL